MKIINYDYYVYKNLNTLPTLEVILAKSKILEIFTYFKRKNFKFDKV